MELYVSFISYKCFNLSYFDNNLKYITLQRSIRYLLDKKELAKYFKRKMSLERSSFARLFDFIILLILIFGILFLLVYIYSHMIAASLILAFAADACFFLIYRIRKNIKLEKFTEEKTKELTEKCTLEKLILLSKKDFSDFISGYLERKGFEVIEEISNGFHVDKGDKTFYIPFFQHHPSEELTIKEILTSYRIKNEIQADNLLFITTGSINSDAEKFLNKIDKNDTFKVKPKELLAGSENQSQYPTIKQIDEFIICEILEEKTSLEDIKKEAFKKNKYRAYIGLGLIIMLWSYFAGFKFYYPLISCFCFVLAYISFKKQKNAKSSFLNLS
jgi:hypothetical protein